MTRATITKRITLVEMKVAGHPGNPRERFKHIYINNIIISFLRYIKVLFKVVDTSH